MRQTTLNRLTVAALGALALLPTGSAIAKDSGGENVSVQPLSSALEAVCREAGLQLVYSSYLSKGLTTKGVTPGKSVQDSLLELLKNSGLTFEFVNDHTVTIVRVQKPGKADDKAVASSRFKAPNGAETPWAYSDSELSEDALALVTVTGTHMTGVAPVGAQLITVNRREIDRTGYATVQDVVRSLPQNFNGGASEDFKGIGQEGLFNFSTASGVNLRGLGSGSTLVLLNGRRLAPGASDGRFVDISGIPLSAVERIEVLPDGASAIYGADAVGGVINFILRDDYEGAETIARLGSSTQNSPTESQVAQTLGTHWKSGNALLSMEFYKRDELLATDRERTASSDLRRFGGDNFDVIYGSPGTITDLSNTWAIPSGQNGSRLQPGDLVAGTSNLHNQNEGRDILPDTERWSVVSRAKQNVSERIDLFADLLIAQRQVDRANLATQQLLTVPNTNPFYVNPTGGTDPIYVDYGFLDDMGPEHNVARVGTQSAAVGFSSGFFNTWKATSYLSYARYGDKVRGGPYVDGVALSNALADSNPETAFNPLGDGSYTNEKTLAGIRQFIDLDRSLSMRGANFTADGIFSRWLDREWRLAVGADYMEQMLHSSTSLAGSSLSNEDLNRSVTASYAELLLPLVDATHGRLGVREANISLAGRYERYSDFGGAFTPRVGFNWSPMKNFAIRGTWSKSFKAPDLLDLDESHNISSIYPQSDPAGPNGMSNVLVLSGGNRDLQDQNSKTWTLGTEWKNLSRGLSMEMTYFNIDFRDRVERVEYSTQFLVDPTFADVVSRNPTNTERLAACARNPFVGVGDCATASIAAIVDLRKNNVAEMRTSGVDWLGKYRLENGLGTFDLSINTTYTFDFSQAQFRSSPLISLLDTSEHPLDLRFRTTVGWRRGVLGINLTADYTDGYHDRVSSPNRDIGSWTTFDLQLSYDSRASDLQLLENTSIALTVQNVLDTNPPFFNNPEGLGYDTANADLLGRFMSLRLRKDW
jgi:outer membrane receptor protein involved in Fe transport